MSGRICGIFRECFFRIMTLWSGGIYDGQNFHFFCGTGWWYTYTSGDENLILNLIFKINNENYDSVHTKLLNTTKIDHFYLQIYLKYQTSSITLKSANWSRPQRQNWLVVWHKTSRSARSLVFFDLLARSHIPQDIVLMSLTAHGTRTSPQVASCRERDDIVIYCNPLVGVVLEAATHYRPAEATNYYWAVWCLLARSEEIGVVNVAL